MQESKPTLAFVDHIFHKKTGSVDFLRDILSSNFKITDYWINPYGENVNLTIPEKTLNDYEYVHFFQRINPALGLKKIRAKLSFSVMYDSFNTDYFYWKILSFLPIKIICFSEKIYSHCQKFGVDAIKVKYYSDPDSRSTEIPKDGRHIFFWYRGQIKFDDIKKIIDPNQIDSFTYLENPDPKYFKENISEEDIRRFKMKIIKSDLKPDKNDYLKLLYSANIFIAPRKREGIGMSFIEALVAGQCVIACDDGTMNEYINDEVDGYLFNLKNPKIINFANIESIRKHSYDRAKKGYDEWQKSKSDIVKFLLAPYHSSERNYFIKKIFEILYAIKLKIFTMRYGR
jgi:hypothetical protein